MGVFGTLRKDWCNHHLMGRKVGTAVSAEYQYERHYKAFLPHFVATGLSLHHSRNASAPCEAYVYDAANWNKMIVPVDRLEGFIPTFHMDQHSWYHRTLVWLHVLPANFAHPLFDDVKDYGKDRDLKIPPSEWDKYAKLPCWVYLSTKENEMSKRIVESQYESPIIWDGVVFSQSHFSRSVSMGAK